MKKKSPSTRKRSKAAMNEERVRAIVREVIEDTWVHTTKSQLEAIAHSAAKQAVHEVLMTIGIDSSHPIHAQKTFGALNGLVQAYQDPDFQADMAQVRAWRTSTHSLKDKTFMTVIGGVVTGVMALIVLGLNSWKN